MNHGKKCGQQIFLGNKTICVCGKRIKMKKQSLGMAIILVGSLMYNGGVTASQEQINHSIRTVVLGMGTATFARGGFNFLGKIDPYRISQMRRVLAPAAHLPLVYGGLRCLYLASKAPQGQKFNLGGLGLLGLATWGLMGGYPGSIRCCVRQPVAFWGIGAVLCGAVGFLTQYLSKTRI